MCVIYSKRINTVTKIADILHSMQFKFYRFYRY